jgi:hypothetical protein
MAVIDVARLRQLADRARRRLPAEPHCETAAPVVEHRLSRAVAAAEGSPTERGLAILVSHDKLALVTLPFEPRDRAVVDREFATRDLEYALRRYPMLRVVLLGRHPRLFEGRGEDLSEVDIAARLVDSPRVLPVGSERQDIDLVLDHRVLISGKLPLLVIGDRRRCAAFRRHSRHAREITAEAHRSRTRPTPVRDIALQALTRWHHARHEVTEAELHKADALHQVAWGLAETWHAVATRTAERIWVEHDFAHPGRIVPGVEGVKITSDPAEPGAIDDLVDTLIARANLFGIPVELLDSGALHRSQPIAAKMPTMATEPRKPYQAPIAEPVPSPSPQRVDTSHPTRGSSARRLTEAEPTDHGPVVAVQFPLGDWRLQVEP